MTTDDHWLTLPNLATGSPCLIWLPLPLAPTRPVEQCARTARALRLDHPVSGGAIPLRKALKAVLETAPFSQYEVMTKQAYNLLIGQKKLWVSGEREQLLQTLCTRDGRTWITLDFFVQVRSPLIALCLPSD